jgi:hypothetical protein
MWDWAALLGRLENPDRNAGEEPTALWQPGLFDGEAGWQAREYIHTLRRALEGRDRAPLLRMLDAGVPIPQLLVPVLADALRSAAAGPTRCARNSKLTAGDEGRIRWLFDMWTASGNQKPPSVRRALARQFGVSLATINRAVRRSPRIRPAGISPPVIDVGTPRLPDGS